jgi:LPXTG-site transpeptidase (sortase) family protein
MARPSRRLGLQQGYRTRSTPPERLVIPAIGMDSRVISIGTRVPSNAAPVWETAPFAVGHHRGTANAGEIGNVVLSGHISSPNEGAVFRRLPQLKIDDGVVLVTDQKSFLYRVRDIRVVLPTAIEVLDPTDVAVVTLITCVPDGVYSHRLVVRAEAL